MSTPQIKVGDYVYAIEEGYVLGSDAARPLIMERAEVVGVGKVEIRLKNSGLAFGCRSRFPLSDVGFKIATTPEQALEIYHSERHQQAHNLLEASRRQSAQASIVTYTNAWEGKTR